MLIYKLINIAIAVSTLANTRNLNLTALREQLKVDLTAMSIEDYYSICTLEALKEATQDNLKEKESEIERVSKAQETINQALPSCIQNPSENISFEKEGKIREFVEGMFAQIERLEKLNDNKDEIIARLEKKDEEQDKRLEKLESRWCEIF